MKELFAMEAARNSVYPIGGGLWVPVYHPELRISTPYREWNFTGDIIRMPEFIAPALGNRANKITIKTTAAEKPEGVLYALGGAGGGLTCFVDGGRIVYEYNLFIIQRTQIRSERSLEPGSHTIVIDTSYVEARPGGPLSIVISVDGEEWARGTVPISAPLLFTANDCLDIGRCLGGAVSLDYFDKVPFPYTGAIDSVHVLYST
jgi:arylsulfatase